MTLKNMFFSSLICGLFIFSGLVSADLLENEGFEDVSFFNTHYCCRDVLFAGCTHNTIPQRHPNVWNDYANTRDFVRTVSESYSGDWAVKVWSTMSSNCTYETGSTCGAYNYTYEGNVRQSIEDSSVDNTSLQLSFYTKKCPVSERPYKCSELWYANEYYGDEPIHGDYKVNIQYNNGNQSANVTYIGEAQTNWTQTILDLSSVSGLNHSWTNFNMTINLQVLVTDYFDTEQRCVIFDNVNLSHVEPLPPPPATEYIADMLEGKPFTANLLSQYGGGTYNNDFEFNLSVGFDGVPLGQSGNSRQSNVLTCSHFDDEILGAYIYYKDGTSLDIIDYTSLTVWCVVNRNYHYDFEFPIPDYENVANITMYGFTKAGSGGSYTSMPSTVIFDPAEENMYIRQSWDNEIAESGYETVTGVPYIYPVLFYNTSVNDTTIYFTAYNFLPHTEAETNNLHMEQYDEDDHLKEIFTTTGSFTSGISHHNFDWLVSPETTDYVMMYFYSDMDYTEPCENWSTNTSTSFTLSGYLFCRDFCDDDYNFHDATYNPNGICEFTVYLNDSRCYPEEPPSEWEESASELLEPLANATMEVGAYISETWDILDMSFDELTKLIMAIIVSMSIGIWGMKKTENSQYNHIIGLMGIVGGFLFFTVFGWLPIWIGVLMTIFAGFMLVRGIVSVFLS